MRARPTIVAVVLAAALALTGCSSGARSSSSAKGAPAGQAAAPAAGAAGPSAAPSGGSGTAAPPKPAVSPSAQIIRTATLGVRVHDVTAALATARSAAEDAGGYVGKESTRRASDGRMTSTIVLRVPQSAYDRVLARLSGTGTLLSRSSDAEDVTSQVVDVNSRIASQRASITRIRALMKQASDLSDVVSLEGELTTRESALESLLAEQASLGNRTAFATVTLNLSEPPVTVHHAPAPHHGPGITDALAGGWHAFVAVLRWIVLVVGAMAPFLAVAALGLLAWRLVRRRSQAAGTAPGPDTASTAEEDNGAAAAEAQDEQG